MHHRRSDGDHDQHRAKAVQEVFDHDDGGKRGGRSAPRLEAGISTPAPVETAAAVPAPVVRDGRDPGGEGAKASAVAGQQAARPESEDDARRGHDDRQGISVAAGPRAAAVRQSGVRGEEPVVPAAHHRAAETQAVVDEQLRRRRRRRHGRRHSRLASGPRSGGGATLVRGSGVSDRGQRQTAIRVLAAARRGSRRSRRRHDDGGRRADRDR